MFDRYSFCVLEYVPEVGELRTRANGQLEDKIGVFPFSPKLHHICSLNGIDGCRVFRIYGVVLVLDLRCVHTMTMNASFSQVVKSKGAITAWSMMQAISSRCIYTRYADAVMMGFNFAIVFAHHTIRIVSPFCLERIELNTEHALPGGGGVRGSPFSSPRSNPKGFVGSKCRVGNLAFQIFWPPNASRASRGFRVISHTSAAHAAVTVTILWIVLDLKKSRKQTSHLQFANQMQMLCSFLTTGVPIVC